MNIYSRVAIQNAARKAAEKRDDRCPHAYGTEQREVWVDAYVDTLDAIDREKAAMSAQLARAVLV